MPNVQEPINKQNLQDDAGDLSIHGLPKLITTTSSSKKIFWLICCCVALGSFAYFTINIVQLHFSYETYLSTKVNLKARLNFPAVTFCDTNHNTLFARSGDVKFQHLPNNCTNINQSDFVTPRNKEYFERACKTFMATSNITTMMAYADGLKFPDNFTFVPNSWPCFTLNRNATLEQLEADERNGFRAMLFYNESERASWPSSPSLGVMEERQGLYVDIHDQAEHIHKLHGIILPTGFHTHIVIRKITTIRKKKPFHSDCYEDTENGYIKVMTGKHTMSNCLFACMAREVYTKCNDLPSFYRVFMKNSAYPKRNNMTTEEVGSCAKQALKNFSHIENQWKTCNCRVPCEQIDYEAKVTRNPWPQSWQAEYLSRVLSDVTKIPENQIGLELMKKHMIKISIYYDEMTETEITEKELYETAKIVSDLGGQMGMFMGASLLSLIELMVLTCTIFSKWWTRPKDDTADKKSDQS
eukprot:Seg1852.1 transcript_id=Seg1852.1/GoldUCD/mRNA.D3Y31 product="Acid-sensing ion channel 5" protein_id=Seg1852.1/GoldUCD/D3Y31